LNSAVNCLLLAMLCEPSFLTVSCLLLYQVHLDYRKFCLVLWVHYTIPSFPPHFTIKLGLWKPIFWNYKQFPACSPKKFLHSHQYSFSIWVKRRNFPVQAGNTAPEDVCNKNQLWSKEWVDVYRQAEAKNQENEELHSA
jgi:hypothetical protein